MTASTSRRSALARTLLVGLVLALLAAACGGEEDLVADDPTEEAVAEADGTVAEDEPQSEETAETDEGLFDDAQLAAVLDCADGDIDACVEAEQLLGDDGVRDLADLCEAGDPDACAAFDGIVVNGLGSAEGGDGGDPALEEPAPDEPAGDDVGVSSGAGDGLVVANGVGVEAAGQVWSFGSDGDEVVSAISADLGEPTSDTGALLTGDGSGCPGEEYRQVSWADDLSITILDQSEFGEGYLHLAAWQHDGGPDVIAQAFVGDATTFSITPGFTTVTELQDNLGVDAVEVYDEEPFGPRFEVVDNFGTLLGELTDVSDEGIVQTVFSGSGCGE